MVSLLYDVNISQWSANKFVEVRFAVFIDSCTARTISESSNNYSVCCRSEWQSGRRTQIGFFCTSLTVRICTMLCIEAEFPGKFAFIFIHIHSISFHPFELSHWLCSIMYDILQRYMQILCFFVVNMFPKSV